MRGVLLHLADARYGRQDAESQEVGGRSESVQKSAKAQARSHKGGGEAWYGARSGGKVEVAWTQQRVRQLACGGRKELPQQERAGMHERLQGRLDKPRGARHSLTEVLGDVAPPLVGAERHTIPGAF